LGLKTATTEAGSPLPLEISWLVTAAGAYRLSLSFSRDQTWRMEAVSSSELKGLTRNSRAPASMERRR
jgi:hypothetical protein